MTQKPLRDIRARVEGLCEDLILAQPESLDLLRQVCGELESVAAWAADAGLPEVHEGAAAAVTVLQDLISGTADDPAGNLDVVARAAATIQAIVCDGRSAAENPFPTDLKAGATVKDPSAAAMPIYDVDKDLLEAFISEANEHLGAAEEHLLALESSPASQEDVHAIFRAFHTIKGAAAFLNFDHIRLLAHEMESVLERVRNGQLVLADTNMDVLLRATDALRRRVNNLGAAAARSATAAPDTELPEILASIQAVTAGQPEAKPGPEPGTRPPEEGGAPAARPGAVIREAVKVDADRLDRLLDTIGELVIAESMISQSRELKKFASPELERQARQLDKITRSLQQMSTSLRLVPVRPVFLRMARLVRDLARRAGKRIEFSISGEDTEIDKAVVDHLADPLVHLLRNAVDHGLEDSPDMRQRAGKPPAGHIELRAFHRGGSIYVEVEDDGRGFDRDAILAKAIQQGLAAPGASLSDQDVYSFVFQPGFSTTNTVTDISGRGVGLDVVKRYVESLRGQIDVQSQPGRRCVVGMRLPLTLAIVDGMVVRVGNERYIAPTLSIVRSLRPAPGDYSTVVGRGEMLKTEGRLIPLFRLARLFEVAGARENFDEALVVVVEDNGQQVGLLVDELQGQQQIVIKGFGEHLRNVLGISGGAIMPDGTVGLILDVGGLVKLAHSSIFAEASVTGAPVARNSQNAEMPA